VRRPRAPALPVSFYDRPAEVVARELLGTTLVCRTDDGIAAGRIVETEAYLGPHDPACHAAAGVTSRTRILYGPPGVAYVYFIYGMHWCMNAVVRENGFGAAVLLRALEPVSGVPLMRERRRAARHVRDLARGPGNLCRALGIDGSHNGLSLSRGKLRILAGAEVPDEEVSIGPRIGIRKAADWPLRFWVTGNASVSRG
jgi:DNA-3-methyladenine glycosylase